MEIHKQYGVITDIQSDDDSNYIETKTYAQACQLASSMIKNKEVETAYVIIRYQADEPIFHA